MGLRRVEGGATKKIANREDASRENGPGLVRDELLRALYCGRLRPGDRVPSVRRMADRTGLNPKTVHRHYRELADAGFLRLREGSGTYLADAVSAHARAPAVEQLMQAAETVRGEARKLGVTEAQLGGFLAELDPERWLSKRLAVVECNEEQIGLISLDLVSRLGCRIRPVMLSALRDDRPVDWDGVDGVVTTDCHRDEVQHLIEHRDVPLYRIALTEDFARVLAARARRGPLVMVVRDERFDPIFKQFLRTIGYDAEVTGAIAIATPETLKRTLVRAGTGSLYISPTVANEVDDPRTKRFEPVVPGPYLTEDSVCRVRLEVAWHALHRSTSESRLL